MGRADLDEKALNSAIHGVIKGVKNEELLSDFPIKPYGEDRKLPEEQSSTLSISFLLISSALGSST